MVDDCKVAVLVPETGTVHIEWALQLLRLGGWTKIFTLGGRTVDIARNILVNRALEQGAEWLFFLDSDVLIPDGTIDKLVERNRPIISGMVKMKSGDGTLWCAGVNTNDGKFLFTNTADWTTPLITADVVGCGCLLVHSSVFWKIKGEYPDLQYFEFTKDRGYKPEKYPDPLMANVGEDIYFCLLAKKCGYEITVDTTVRCEHISTIMLGEHIRVAGEKHG